MSNWINAIEKLPEVGQQVLCLGVEPYEDDDGHIKHRNVYDLGEVEKEGYSLSMYAFDFECYVTHWMPLPKPPVEAKEHE